MWYFLGCKCFLRGGDEADAKSASFSIELPPPGEGKVPYADIHHQPVSAATTMERPHVRDTGSIHEATYPGRGSRQASYHGSAADMGPRSASHEKISYHGSRDPMPMEEKRSYHGSRDLGPPRTGSRQDLPRYGSRQDSRERLPSYEKDDRYGSHDSLPRKEPYPRGSREPSYHGSRDSLPRKEPPRYDEPYRPPSRGSRDAPRYEEPFRDPPYRPPSREYLNRTADRPPSRGSRDAPPYRSSREDLRDDYDDADSDQGSEML